MIFWPGKLGVVPIASAAVDLDAAVRALFANGEQGFWYDPSDAATMFQDATGGTPGAQSQPVGLILSKHAGAARQDKIVADAWTPNVAQVFYAAGKIAMNGLSPDANGYISNTGQVVSGRPYLLRYTVDGYTAGSVSYGLGPGVGTQSSTATSGAGLKSEILVATVSGVINMRARGSSATMAISGMAVEEIQPTYGRQATSAARPTLMLTASGKPYLWHDQVDDVTTTTFAAALGSACTVARAIPGSGAQIQAGQNIGTNLSNNVSHAGMVVINRALTTVETANLTGWLNARAL